MFNHVMVGADDIEVSKRFYDAVLGTLGYPSGHLDKKGRVWWRTETGVFGITKPIDGNKSSHVKGVAIGVFVDRADFGGWP